MRFHFRFVLMCSMLAVTVLYRTGFSQTQLRGVAETESQASVDAKAGTQPSPLWDRLVDKSPWIFLGDSNTYTGGYIALLEAKLQANVGNDSKASPYLINMGVPSETASGTSEVDHPFKRPWVFERLEKTLSMVRPKVVFFSYGMNDGIYAPPSSEVMSAYQRGIESLVNQLKQSGAIVVCLTPSMFEPEPVAARGKLGPSKEGRFAYFAPSPKYNDQIFSMATWCAGNPFNADAVVDVYSTMANTKAKLRESDPSFNFTTDGIHYGEQGHELVAKEILETLGAPQTLIDQSVGPAELSEARSRMQILRDAWLSATGKNRPGLAAGWPEWYARTLVEIER